MGQAGCKEEDTAVYKIAVNSAIAEEAETIYESLGNL
jgi:hypothetical protein